MKFRRLILPGLFIGIWLVILLTPELRYLWLSRAGGPVTPQEPGDTLLTEPLRWVTGPFSHSLGEEEMAARYSNNAQVQYALAGQQLAPVKQIENYNRLIKRFPNAAWIVANQLRYVMSGFKIRRVAGEIDYPPTPTPTPQAAPPRAPGAPLAAPPVPIVTPTLPPDLDKGSDLKPEILQSYFEMARYGRKLEPENSYFDWMLACFLFGTHRDEEALRVLHEGAQKKSYDAHLRDDMKARIAVRELNRPLQVFDKIAILAAQLYPHLSQQRAVANLAVWQGILAERKGDHQRALQIYSDVARLGRLMRRGSSSYIECSVANSVQRAAWNGTAIANGQTVARTRTPQTSSFVSYASRHGRRDLAREAWAEAATGSRIRAFRNPNSFYANISNETIGTIVLLSSIALDFVNQLPFIVMLWLALTIALGVQARRVESHRNLVAPEIRERPGDEMIRSRDVAGGVIGWAFLVTLLPLAEISIVVVKLMQSSGGFSFAGFSEYVLSLLFGGYDDERSWVWGIAGLRTLSQFVPTLYMILVCIGIAARRQRHTTSIFTHIRNVTKALIAGAPFNPKVDLDLLPLARAIMSSFLLLAVVALGIVLPAFIAPSLASTAAILFFIACLVYYSLTYLRLPRPRAAWSYAWRCYRQTLGVLLVLVSLCYLIFSAASLPARRDADAKLNALIQYGEVQAAMMSSGQSLK